MIRCAIIETATNIVVNVIEYETVPEGTPPGFEDGHIAVASDTAGPGFVYNPADGTFTDTRPPQPQPGFNPLNPNYDWGPTLVEVIGKG